MDGSFNFPEPDLITVGTVGPVGQRVFYLQAREGHEIATLKVEKGQVAGLAQALAAVLSDLPPLGDDVPVDTELIEPVEQAWVVGALAVTPYDEVTGRVYLAAQELVAKGEESREARFGLTQAQMVSLVARGAALVTSGRPACPVCHLPMDPDGHACPRTNGQAKKL